MIKLITVVALVALCSFAFAADAPDVELNNAIDAMFLELKQGLVNDTIKLDIKGQKLSHKFGPLETSAEATWSKTRLTGVRKTMRRDKNARVKWGEGDKPNVLTLPLAFGPLKFTTTGKVQIMAVGPSRKYTGSVKYVDAKAIVSYNSTKDALSLRSLEINEMSGFEVKEEGLPLPSRVIRNQFLKMAIQSFERLFKRNLGKDIYEALKSEVKTWAQLKPLLS